MRLRLPDQAQEGLEVGWSLGRYGSPPGQSLGGIPNLLLTTSALSTESVFNIL